MPRLVETRLWLHFSRRFFANQTVSPLFTTEQTGDSQYTGSAYVTDWSIEVPYDGVVKYSGTLTGVDALVRSLT